MLREGSTRSDNTDKQTVKRKRDRSVEDLLCAGLRVKRFIHVK